VKCSGLRGFCGSGGDPSLIEAPRSQL
jgi:hypothetical protein